MRYISLFSGIEAATVAWHPLGWEAVAFAEVDPFGCALLKHHYPDVPNLGDVTKITAQQISDLGHIDLVVFGSPCQDLSIAGKRAGLKGDRSGLFFDAMRIVRWSRARWGLFENVPGLFSSNDGRDFASVVGEMAGVEFDVPGGGWRNTGVCLGRDGIVEWAVLDAQWFGVPQRRRRIFALRDIGDWRNRSPLLFERLSLSGNSPPRRETGKGFTHAVAPSLTGSGRGVERGGDSRGQDPVVAMALNAKGGSGRIDAESETFVTAPLTGNPYGDHESRESLLVAQPINAGSGKRGYGVDENYITHVLRADGFDASEDGTGRGTPLTVPILEAGARTGTSTTDPRAGIGIGEDGDPMFTLQSGKQHAIAFDTTQITSAANYSNPKPGDPCHPLAASAHVPAVAIGGRARGDDGRGYSRVEHISDVAGSLDTVKPDRVFTPGMAVRRLTPMECERLQGFPDRYTAVPHRGKPAADGSRYKSLGNSMAVPVMRWVGERIQAVERLIA